MKTINLFFDFEFTSLSPDAQPISLGIVSDEIISGKEVSRHTSEFGNMVNYEAGTIGFNPKSFYAEFSDFDINRCDDWVKENVVSKLEFYPETHDKTDEYDLEYWDMCLPSNLVATRLKKWLSQFSDYQIQFICDCCTWDWWFMVQLLAEWDNKFICQSGEYKTREEARCKGCYAWDCRSTNGYSMGLPKLHDNISPVPFDLNDLIAIKKGITPKEAFNLNREALWEQDIIGWSDNELKSVKEMTVIKDHTGENILNKHNALFDAKVIKEIYNKLH